MHSFPKISVVTPSFNQASYLESCLKSVIGQSYPNLEYIVIDGGSTDGSVDLLHAYNSSLSHWESEPDRGHGHALNKGFSRSTGSIMCWINSDDILAPGSLNTVARLFSEFPHVAWMQGQQSWINVDGTITGSKEVPKSIFDFLTGDYAWIQQESVFWRRSLWNKAGGYINENYKLMVDGELWTRFFLHAKLHTVSAILGCWRMTGNNRGRERRNECHQEMKSAIRIMKDKLSKDELALYRQAIRMRAVAQSPWIKRFNLGALINFLYFNQHSPMNQYTKVSTYPMLRFDYNQGMWVEYQLPMSIY